VLGALNGHRRNFEADFRPRPRRSKESAWLRGFTETGFQAAFQEGYRVNVLVQRSRSGGYAVHGFRYLPEQPFLVSGFLVDEEIGEESVLGVLDGDHDADRPVVFGHDDRLPAGRVEEIAEVVLGAAGGHDFHCHIRVVGFNMSIVVVATMGVLAVGVFSA